MKACRKQIMTNDESEVGRIIQEKRGKKRIDWQKERIKHRHGCRGKVNSKNGIRMSEAKYHKYCTEIMFREQKLE